MVYAKQIKDGVVVSVLTYNYVPHLSEDSGTVAITEEEYNELLAELQARPQPEPPAITERHISDSEALAIITGEVSADDA